MVVFDSLVKSVARLAAKAANMHVVFAQHWLVSDVIVENSQRPLVIPTHDALLEASWEIRQKGGNKLF
jgi:hypothetical protein